MKTQTKRNLIGLAVVIVIVVIAAVAPLWVKSNALEREIAAWEAAGLPLDPKELLPPAPPDEENAAVAFLEVMAEVEAREFPMPLSVDPEELATYSLAEHVRFYESEIDRLQELIAADTLWVWPPSTFQGELVPDTPPLRQAAKLLLEQAQVRAEDGDHIGMMASLDCAMHLADHAEMLPTMMGALLQCAIDQAVLQQVEEVGTSTPMQTREIEQHLRKRDYRQALLRGLKGEAASIWSQHDSWESKIPTAQLPLGSFWLKRDAAFYFASMREAIQRLEVPYLQQEDPEWGPEEGKGGFFSGLFLPYFAGPNRNAVEMEAHRRMALFAFELRRQKEALGSYEAALAATAVPLSPITGEPFTVVIDETGLRISTPPARGDEPIEWRWE